MLENKFIVNDVGVALLGDPHFEEITKIKGEPQMINHVTVGAVTHTHTHTHTHTS